MHPYYYCTCGLITWDLWGAGCTLEGMRYAGYELQCIGWDFEMCTAKDGFAGQLITGYKKKERKKERKFIKYKPIAEVVKQRFWQYIYTVITFSY